MNNKKDYLNEIVKIYEIPEKEWKKLNVSPLPFYTFITILRRIIKKEIRDGGKITDSYTYDYEQMKRKFRGS